MTADERQKMYFPMFGVAAALIILNVSYYSYGMLVSLGWNNWVLDYFIDEWAMKMNAYNSQYTLKMLTLFCLVLMQMLKAGKGVHLSWKRLWTYFAVAMGLFLFPLIYSDSLTCQAIYMVTSVAGFVMTGHAVALLGRKINGLDDDLNDMNETFAQCRALVPTDDSFNLRMKFRWHHKTHYGWINVVNPFRATMVLGTPGSGKSYSVFNPIIEQGIKKGYTMFCYDYKYPALTNIVYNTYLENRNVYKEKYGKDVRFCVINFNDPRNSMRCNPIHPRYIRDGADTSEIADIIMKNINPQSIEREDFFSMSAKVYIDANILFLSRHEGGRYCTFPHLIELLGSDYKDVFEIIKQDPQVRIKIKPFENALKDKALEQLQGQLASAQIPLLKFASPTLYWVLSGDDFPLDINNPEHPEIMCIGNDPDRQSIYGTTLALFTSRMFREINRPGKLKSLVLFDELPTVFLKGLDNLIATARSNLVAIVLGAQDVSQLIRDYTEKEARVIFNTIGNFFSGQISGRNAKEASEMFGREFRQQQSETTGGENDTINTSYHQQEILTQTRIEMMPQGMFFGKVADDYQVKKSIKSDHDRKEYEKKLFCCEILIDNEAFAARKKKWVPVSIADPDGKKHSIFDDLDRRVQAKAEEDPRETCISYLVDVLKQEKVNETNYSDIGARTDAEAKYDTLTEDAINDTFKKAVMKAQEKAVSKMVEDNYNRIVKEIKQLITDEKNKLASQGIDNKAVGGTKKADETEDWPA